MAGSDAEQEAPGNLVSSSATARPTSRGFPVQMLTMPLATAIRVVEVRSCVNVSERPGSKPPDDQSAAIAQRLEFGRYVKRGLIRAPCAVPPHADLA